MKIIYSLYVIIVFLLFSAGQSAAQNKSLTAQIRNNLTQGRLHQAFDRSMQLITMAKTDYDNFYGRYFYVMSCLLWEDKAPENKMTFKKFKTYFSELDKYVSKNDKNQNDELGAIKKAYKKMFKPLTLIIESELKDYAPTGYFLVILDTDNNLLEPIQQLRMDEIKKIYSNQDEYQKFNFEIIEGNSFKYIIKDVPVIQAQNPRTGYSISFRQRDYNSNKETKQESLEEITPFNLSITIGAVLKPVNKEYIKSALPDNYVLLKFKGRTPDFVFSGLDPLNKSTFKRDGYMILETQDKMTIGIQKEKEKDNSNFITVTSAVSALAVIIFIIAR